MIPSWMIWEDLVLLIFEGYLQNWNSPKKFEKLSLWKLETISKHWSTRDPSNLSMWFPNNECSLKNLLHWNIGIFLSWVCESTVVFQSFKMFSYNLFPVHVNLTEIYIGFIRSNFCLHLQLQLGRWDNFIPVSSSHLPHNVRHRLFCQARSSSRLTGLS